MVGDNVRLNYAKGCDLMGLSKKGFAPAVKAAEESDVAVVVIGDTSMILSGVGWEDPSLPSNGAVGEGYDVTDPVPPGVQQDLVKAICRVGKPTVVVMLHGRPYSVPWMKEHVPAIVDAFYPGEEQGRAIAERPVRPRQSLRPSAGFGGPKPATFPRFTIGSLCNTASIISREVRKSPDATMSFLLPIRCGASATG